MVRDGKVRKKRYEKGLDPDVIAGKFGAQKDLMVEQESVYLVQIADVELKIKGICEGAGVSTLDVAQYLNFGREMWTKSNRFSGGTLAAEAQLLVDKWVGRGLVGALLVRIAGLFGVTPTAPVDVVVTRLDDAEFLIKFPSDAVAENISVAAPTATTERTIVVTLPSGASRVRVLVGCFITAANRTANAQDIDVQLQGRKGAGAWNNLLTLTDHMTLPAVDRAMTGDALLADCTSLVDEAATYGFRCTITLSAANAVRFKTQYLLIVTYRMS